ncbi:MAG: hypothetical protein OFPI_01470 [Osedax symbiont Rs2]|nr:MAG: hypothetical protein OFPI_01470 [Osedax symbiont Rs2]
MPSCCSIFYTDHLQRSKVACLAASLTAVITATNQKKRRLVNCDFPPFSFFIDRFNFCINSFFMPPSKPANR